MIGVDEIEDIRKRARGGEPIASIARAVGASEPTVRKYARMEDLSPEPPRRREPDAGQRVHGAHRCAMLCFVNLSFHKTASVRFTRQREDSSRTSVALAPILSSPTTPRA